MVLIAFKSRARAPADGLFASLLQPHLPRLFQLGYRLTGDRHEAEDLVQDVCLKFIPDLSQLQTLDAPGPWLARCLYREFIDRHRHQQRSPVSYTDELPETASEAPGPEAAAIAALTQEQIEQALQQLSPEARAVVVWHDVEGYTLDELARQLDTPLGTLKSRLHRARLQLREILMQPFVAARRVS
jgi:RNA polymerase sigma-70 factor, ECF subfamily